MAAQKSSYTPIGSTQERKEAVGCSPDQRSLQQQDKRQSRRCGHWSDDSWLVETACAVMGAVLIVALCLVLRAYDGKATPQFGSAFGSALTLNAIVAIIAAVLFPVAECISQLKWTWFAKDYRPLSDLNTFDKASRGVFGGFELLWKTRLASFASIGSFLLILGIAIDPLSRQLISYVSDQVPSTGSNATVGITKAWTDTSAQGVMVVLGSGFNDDTFSSISTGMKGAIQIGLYSGNETIPDIAPACDGGNCTFEPYFSLAVCTSFADVSSHLVYRNMTPTDDPSIAEEDYRLYVSPNRYIQLAGFTAMNVTSAGSMITSTHSSDLPFGFSESVAFKGVDTPLADVFVFVMNGTENQHATYTAIEFVLEWCVQNFTTTVTNGSAVTQRHNAFRNFTQSSSGSLPSLDPFGGNDYTTKYGIDPTTHSSLQSYLRTLFNGTVSEGYDLYWYTTSDAAQTLFEPFNVLQAHLASEVFEMSNGIKGTNQTRSELIANNIATSITN
ncbi:hypothetical protein LTR27_010738 [Elasticomyces elasticus]|nr:hypothetical protein LTR27_010738 [Elasticomyces elasticus]